jgi:hypothetical protein
VSQDIVDARRKTLCTGQRPPRLLPATWVEGEPAEHGAVCAHDADIRAGY